MTTTVEMLSAQAAQLPPAERMEVVERILDSFTQKYLQSLHILNKLK